MNDVRKGKFHMARIWKKTICMVMVAAMIIVYMPNDIFGKNNISKVKAATTYNGGAAANYGLTYTDNSGGTNVNSYNSGYAYFQGNDCANYVSQCLVAGGLQTDGTWYAYSTAWKRADYLLEWFRAKPEYSGLIVRNPSPSDVKIGDPLFYVWGTEVDGKVPNDIDHAGICTGVSGNTPLVSAHSNNRKNFAAWRMNAGAVYVVKLHELSSSQTAHGEMTTPTITTNRNCYAVGETMNITWDKTSSQSDFLHYWLIITNTDTSKECYGGATGANGDVNANSYQFTIPEAGHYRINVWAVPYNDKDNRQRMASKTVCTYGYDSETQNLGNDFYATIMNTGIKKYVTADSDDNVTIRTGSNQANQLWHFIRQSNGSYEIVNYASGKALDDSNWGQTNGTNVGVYSRNNTTAQRWFIRGTAGAYFLNASCGSAVLDVESYGSLDGTNVWLYERNDSGAQKFTIQKQSINLSKCSVTGLERIQGGFKLSWQTVSGATKYEIYRKKQTDTNYAKLTTVAGGSTNTYKDTNCVSGVTYQYLVRAVNNYTTGASEYGGYGLYLDSTNVWITVALTKKIGLSWNEVNGANGYYVYMYDTASKKWQRVLDVAGKSTTSCTLSGLKQNTTYNFLVRAYGTCTYNKISIHTSYNSNVLTATTAAYNGMKKTSKGWYYYRNGIKQTNYTGLLKRTNGTWCYIKNGKWQSKFTGIVKHTDGKYYYVYKGRKKNSTKLVKNTDGKWWYVKKGVWQPKYKGIVKKSGKKYYVVKGKKSNKTGYVTVKGKRYRVVKGKVQ